MVNINELLLLHHHEYVKQKLNNSLKWQCIFETNPLPIIILIIVILPTCKTRLYIKLQRCKCCSFSMKVNS